MMVSPFEQERSCRRGRVYSATFPWKHLALCIKCIAFTAQSHHIIAFYSHESISKGCYELFVLYEAGSFREVRMERVSSILTSRKASFLFPLMSRLRQFHHLPGILN